MDSDYVFSLVSPCYSAEGMSRWKLEETVMDNFQDFVSTVGDKNIKGYTEALGWKENNNITDENGVLEATKHQAVDASPARVLGWLTGQNYCPVNGEQHNITACFDHDCRERNPKHTICFPQVGACSREITFPVAHLTDMKEFEHCSFWLFAKVVCIFKGTKLLGVYQLETNLKSDLRYNSNKSELRQVCITLK